MNHRQHNFKQGSLIIETKKTTGEISDLGICLSPKQEIGVWNVYWFMSDFVSMTDSLFENELYKWETI